MVIPKVWQKGVHEGTPSRLDPKQRSMLSYNNLFPVPLIPKGPKGGKVHDGCIDALLMIVYGFQKYGIIANNKWKIEEWID